VNCASHEEGVAAELWARDTAFRGHGIAAFGSHDRAIKNFLSGSMLAMEAGGRMDGASLRIVFSEGVLDFRYIEPKRPLRRDEVDWITKVMFFFRLCKWPETKGDGVYKVSGMQYDWMLLGNDLDEFTRKFLLTRLRCPTGVEVRYREEVR